LLVKLLHLGGGLIAGFGKIDCGDGEAGGAEAGVYGAQLEEAFDEKAGSGEEDESEGDFGDDEGSAQAFAADENVSSAFSYAFAQFAARGLQGGRETENEAGDEAEADGEEQDAEVGVDFCLWREQGD
jgi:hypothetical protein